MAAPIPKIFVWDGVIESHPHQDAKNAGVISVCSKQLAFSHSCGISLADLQQ
jgi:hypothetical protein